MALNRDVDDLATGEAIASSFMNVFDFDKTDGQFFQSQMAILLPENGPQS